MIKVGLTGGYATGKSFVAQELERLGCHIVYADQLGHQVLLGDGEAYTPVVEAFGKEILDENGRIDRKKLGSVVFHSTALLERLTAIIHPAVYRLEEHQLAAHAAQDPSGIAIVEAAILIETGRYKRFDRLIVTTCDRETQIVRAMKRDSATREEVLARLGKQLSAGERLKFAHYIVETDGTKEDTVSRVEAIWRELKELAKNQRQ